MKLKDKVAVITGGSSGIGLAIAEAFKGEGAKIVIFGRNQDRLAAAERHLGDSAFSVSGSVTNVPDLDRLFKFSVERYKKIDILVANVGVFNFTPLGQTTEEDFDRASDINFKSIFFTVQAALPYLNDGSSLIITGNALTSTPMLGPSVTLAAKSAGKSLVRTFAVELAPRGIRVNTLSPGPTGKGPTTPTANPNQGRPRFNQIPLGRSGNPQDLGKAAVFLASGDASYITGEDLKVGGGIGLGWVPTL